MGQRVCVCVCVCGCVFECVCVCIGLRVDLSQITSGEAGQENSICGPLFIGH